MPVPDAADLVAPAGAQAVTVDRDGDDDDGRLPIAPNYKFFWVHYPNDPSGWAAEAVTEGPGVPAEDVGTWWLPVFTKDFEKPGLCLHRTLQNGEPQRNAYHNAHLTLQAQGATILPRALGYCVGYPCRHPITRREGIYYTDPWSTPRAVMQGRAQKFNFDRQRYNRWRLQLMRDGHIDAPSEDILRELQQRKQARVARRESQYDLPEDKRERLIEDAKREADLLAKAEVPEYAPTPRPKRKAQPKTRQAPKPTVETDDEDA